jgi:hypothetical protein
MAENTEPVRINYTISIGFATAVHRGTFELDRAEWDGMTSDQREVEIEDMFRVELENHLDGGWEVANADLDDPTVTP